MGSMGVAQAAVSHWCRSKKGASASPAHRKTPPYLGVLSGARSMAVGGAGVGGAADSAWSEFAATVAAWGGVAGDVAGVAVAKVPQAMATSKSKGTWIRRVNRILIPLE